MPKEKTLKSIGMTNGEFGQLSEIYQFLTFMQEEKIPIPDVDDKKAIDLTFARYLEDVRLKQMQYISDLRVKRGEKPLPARLLRKKS
jgi:hypothetical protein